MPQQTHKPAYLALSDGTIFKGTSIGVHGTTGGEVCFNTSMTGYQEIFTDPSYYGQLMTMTYPHIGNYGTSARDDEARNVMIAGLIVRSFSEDYSNTAADGSLQEYLERNKLVGISGIDTRKLVRHIRTKGVMNAVISSEIDNEQELVEKAKNWVSMKGLDLAKEVTRKEAQTVESEEGTYRVACFDYGIKQNIINNLVSRGCTLRVFPAQTDFETVMDWKPDAFFFSNGPGDPNPMDYAVTQVEEAKKSGKPIFGICLGHQLLALSEGFEVEKMFVGHRGANHPVRYDKTGLVEITTQNHGFGVKQESIDEAKVEVTHVNLNDGTVEGLNFKNFNGFSVQYHPEASPGPHDSDYLFDEFLDRIKASKKP
jgi:carbamoyl-phosphate synthase small subunit